MASSLFLSCQSVRYNERRRKKVSAAEMRGSTDLSIAAASCDLPTLRSNRRARLIVLRDLGRDGDLPLVGKLADQELINLQWARSWLARWRREGHPGRQRLLVGPPQDLTRKSMFRQRGKRRPMAYESPYPEHRLALALHHRSLAMAERFSAGWRWVRTAIDPAW